MIKLKRAYEKPAKGDGRRILVERLWPRGLTKAEAAIDLWLKDVAPSPELRRWFNHDPDKWPEFQKRYRAELKANPEPVAELRRLLRQGPITFIYAARDEQRNSALLLQQFLTRRGEGATSRPATSRTAPRTTRSGRAAAAKPTATARRSAARPKPAGRRR